MRHAKSNEHDPHFFRCPVQEEDSVATIVILGKKVPAKLQDKSIDGFSVLVEPKHVRKLQVGPRWILHSGNEVTEVWAQWMFNAPDGRVQLGLRRLQDLTPQPKAPWFPRIGAYRRHSGNPELMIAGLIMFGFLTLSLPGLGDKLGTAGMIQSGLAEVCKLVCESVGQYW